MDTYTKDQLWEIRSNWILPDGTIKIVPSERHDSNLPNFCKTVKDAEKSCVKVSCCWGYTAPISKVYLPRKLTVYQARQLVKINDSLKIEEDCNIEKKIDIWSCDYDWNEILELI